MVRFYEEKNVVDSVGVRVLGFSGRLYEDSTRINAALSQAFFRHNHWNPDSPEDYSKTTKADRFHAVAHLLWENKGQGVRGEALHVQIVPLLFAIIDDFVGPHSHMSYEQKREKRLVGYTASRQDRKTYNRMRNNLSKIIP